MSGKYSFTLDSERRQCPLPRKIIIGCQDTETTRHVLLKLLGFLLFLAGLAFGVAFLFTPKVLFVAPGLAAAMALHAAERGRGGAFRRWVDDAVRLSLGCAVPFAMTTHSIGRSRGMSPGTV